MLVYILHVHVGICMYRDSVLVRVHVQAHKRLDETHANTCTCKTCDQEQQHVISLVNALQVSYM